MPIQTRIDIQDDAEQLAKLMSDFGQKPVTPTQIVHRLDRMQGIETVILAEKDNFIIGFGSLRLVPYFSEDELYAEIADLYVEPNFRRYGAARLITEKLEELEISKNTSYIVLVTGYENKGAQEFYRKMGYSDWALAMTKDLK